VFSTSKSTASGAPTAETVYPPTGPPMLRTVLTRPLPGLTVVAVEGEIDLVTAPHLRDILPLDTIEPGGTLIVDMSMVTFLASAGMTVLSQTQQLAHDRGWTLRMVTGPRCVDLPLTVAGLRDALACYPSLAEAVNVPHDAPTSG
jgi:anti-sigma B factor antagonist